MRLHPPASPSSSSSLLVTYSSFSYSNRTSSFLHQSTNPFFSCAYAADRDRVQILGVRNKEWERPQRYCKAKQAGNFLRKVHFPRHGSEPSLATAWPSSNEPLQALWGFYLSFYTCDFPQSSLIVGNHNQGRKPQC